MISDLHKFISTLHKKGKELFDAYQKLKQKLDDLKVTLDKMKADGEHSQEILTQLKTEMEEWRAKARDLQVELDEIRAKYHDLQNEEHELQLKNTQLKTDINVIKKENEGMEKRIEKIIQENEDLRKRILEYEHIKEKLLEKRETRTKLEGKVDRLEEYLDKLKDSLAEQRINNLKNSLPDIGDEEIDSKDTHVDLSMEMYIVHNKTNLYKPTYAPIYYTTEKPYYAKEEQQAKCLISYYGYTNETCWYESEGERSEDNYVDALGHHLVEAHWKYFTIDVADQAECDKAAHLHYEFLINRCSPKHYLPVMSVFRPSVGSKNLGTHFYPTFKPTDKQTCWITFLGAHGHCEADSAKYDLYNTDDTPEGYSQGSGTNAQKCHARAEWWMKHCDTPVIATYVPGGVSSTWQNDWIMHDSHGGRMFEEVEDALNQINPDSMNPNKANANSGYNSEYKSQAAKSADYHDSPEYRKSLHLQGEQKESILKALRKRLGMAGPYNGNMKGDIKQYQGVDTSQANNEAKEYGGNYGGGYEAPKYEAPKVEKYEAPKYEEPKYEAPKYEKYEAPSTEAPKYEAPKYEAPAPEAPKYESPKYEAPAPEAPKYEAPKYEAPKYEAPKYEEPKYEAPKYEEPKYEQPTTEAPKYEEPKYEAPSTEAPKYEEPKYEAPPTEAPKYEAPATEAPKYEEPKYEAPKYEGEQGGGSEEEPDSYKDSIIDFK